MLASDQLMLLPGAAGPGGGSPPPSRLAAAYEPRSLRRYAWEAPSPSSLYPERLAWRALEGLELRQLGTGADIVSLLAEGPTKSARHSKKVTQRDPYAKLRADFPGCFDRISIL